MSDLAGKAFDQDLVSGSVLRSVWKLAWPIVLLNLINGLHGLVDQILVGNFVNEHQANAAIGVAWSIFLVVVVMISSLFNGMGVLVAQYAGQKDREAMGRVMFHTLLTTVYVVLFVIAPVGYVISGHILQFVSPDPDIRRHALPYLHILFVCGVPLSINFLITTALQSSGDAKIPLMLVVLGASLKIALSFVLITGLPPFPELGTLGAAVATCLAPLPGIGIALWLIARRRVVLQLPNRLSLIPDRKLVSEVVRIGVPTGINAVVLNLGAVALYWYLGRLEHSAEAMAAYTICYTQVFSFVTWPSLGLRAASSALMGQNIGAGRSHRGKAAVHLAARLGAMWAIAWGLTVWFAASPILRAFGLDAADEADVVAFGTTFLRYYLSISGVFLAMALALTGGLVGGGETMKTMWIGMISQIGILLGLCQIFLLTGLLSPQAIWMSILISHASRYLLTLLAFNRTEWKLQTTRLDQGTQSA